MDLMATRTGVGRDLSPVRKGTELTRFITSRIVLVLELISDVLGITLQHWPARGVNYSRAELHYISRPVGELINNYITSLFCLLAYSRENYITARPFPQN